MDSASRLAACAAALALFPATLAHASGDAARAVANTKFTGVDEVCGERIATSVFKKAKAQYGAQTAETLSVLEVIALDAVNSDFDLISAFKITVSDEVGGSVWLAVVETEDCVVEYVNTAREE